MPKKSPQFSHTDNLQFLAEHGYTTKRPLGEANAKRQANALRRALARGETPTKDELRGHKAKGIRKDFDPRTKLSYRWLDAPRFGVEFEGQDLAYLLKHSPPQKGDHTLLIVTGIVQHGSPNDPDTNDGDRRTYAYGVFRETTEKWLKANPTTNLIVFLERANPDIKWLSLEKVGLYYPKQKTGAQP